MQGSMQAVLSGKDCGPTMFERLTRRHTYAPKAVAFAAVILAMAIGIAATLVAIEIARAGEELANCIGLERCAPSTTIAVAER